jgi:protein gp37
MSTNSSIEWTDATWNPIAGCAIISPGCTNCYAMRMAHRLAAMGSEKYEGLTRISGGRPKWKGNIHIDGKSLEAPVHWKKGLKIFVNSMSDLFHEDVPIEIIRRVFETMASTPQHTYQVLTKRSDRLREVSSALNWPKNVWMGVSVENADYKFRIDDLRKVPASVRFLSLEPLIGPLHKLNLRGIHWVIAGGESGPGAREIEYDWVRSIRDQCLTKGVAFHFKQWGGINKKKTGRLLDGRTWDEFPDTCAPMHA